MGRCFQKNHPPSTLGLTQSSVGHFFQKLLTRSHNNTSQPKENGEMSSHCASGVFPSEGTENPKTPEPGEQARQAMGGIKGGLKPKIDAVVDTRSHIVRTGAFYFRSSIGSISIVPELPTRTLEAHLAGTIPNKANEVVHMQKVVGAFQKRVRCCFEKLRNHQVRVNFHTALNTNAKIIAYGRNSWIVSARP